MKKTGRMMMTRHLLLLTPVLATVCSLGCASPAKPVNMVPEAFTMTSQHACDVSTMVSGGEQTSPLWTSEISSKGFHEALDAAIQKSQVFQAVAGDGDGDYNLDVVILSVGQPLAGFAITVTMTTRWELTRQSDPEPVWEDFISTTYKAQFGEALYGVARLRRANEGAARNNIKEGIRRLSELDL